jgi:predicted nucleotidyltransferase
MRPEAVLERRRAQREELLERARRFVESLRSDLGLRAAAVFGSVARGDFNQWSDIDLLLVADAVRGSLLERLDALGWRPPLVRPVPWTPTEWRAELARGNPIAVEALEAGVWLVGSPEEL